LELLRISDNNQKYNICSNNNDESIEVHSYINISIRIGAFIDEIYQLHVGISVSLLIGAPLINMHTLELRRFLIRNFWLTVTCPLCHTQQWWANITMQLNILIVRLNCVVPKWSSSYSRVHHLVFTLGQMVCHTGLSNTMVLRRSVQYLEY